MRISSSTFTTSFLNEIQQLEQQQNSLQGQASSGLKVTSPEDNPAVMSQVLNLQTDSAANNQYQNNITQLQSTATTSATAMNGLQTLVSQVNEIATEASSGTNSSTQLSAYATQVESLIQQAVQLGNTQDSGGNYIFSGTASNTQAFTAATDSNGNVTGVTYNGNTEVDQSQIGSNMTVAAQVPGANTTGSGAEGLFADSRTGADLFSHMIALQQDLASGNTSAIASTDVPALNKDEDNIVNQISANGVMQSALTAAGNMATAQSTNLTTQISGDTNADLAQTLTSLSQTQTAYEAALESGTMVMNLTLLNFLA
jgi:flagellar hook-associated protein 3 FlgL